MANGLKDHIEDMKKRLPPGTELHFVMDQSLYVKEAIVSLFQALGGGWFLDREPIVRPLDVGPNSKS